MRALHHAMTSIKAEAHKMKQTRIGGKVVHGLDAEDLVALGWLATIQPLAHRAFEVFLKRGWLRGGLGS